MSSAPKMWIDDWSIRKFLSLPSSEVSPEAQQLSQERLMFYSKFVLGGASGMSAWCFVHPLDLVKNRMQVSAGSGPRPSTWTVLANIVKQEGFLKLYSGLSAGLMRQATYTTTRLGIYTVLFEKYSTSDGKPPGFLVKVGCGLTAGACGAFVGTPADVAIIRMSTDGQLPVNKRRNYTSVFNALARINKEEGVTTLWRGATPTMARAMVVNAAQLATYSQAKELVYSLGTFGEGTMANFVSAMMSGLVTVTASMPVDIAKTRIQNMKTDGYGRPEYKGATDVIMKIARREGVLALWKGFVPAYLRQGPHTVLTLLFFDQFNYLFKKYIL